MIASYRDLEVWGVAMELVADVYQVTRQFPKEEQFGLTAQLRRAAVSVPSNIAEGHARESTKDFLRFIAIAAGSLAELETQLLIAEKLGYTEPPATKLLLERAASVGKMLRRLTQSLQSKLAASG